MKIIYRKTSFRNAVYRALIAVLAGVALILWKDIALKSIIMFIGALFVITGLMASMTSFRKRKETEQDGLLSVSSLGSMLLGVLLICAPLFFATVLMYILGAMFILGAVAQLTTLFSARHFGAVPVISYIFPVLILLAGILIIVNPWDTAMTVVIILGATAIFYGITELISQYSINKLRKRYEESHAYSKDFHKASQTGGMEDVEYEEIK